MAAGRRPSVSLILPTYNEASNLRCNFQNIYKIMKQFGDFEIIIAEDGSTDGSKEIARRLSLKSNVHLLSLDVRSGKGAALKRGISAAKGDIIGYLDIDFAVPLRYVKTAVGMVEGGCDAVIGSRYSGTKVRRSMARLIASKAYNLGVKMITGSKFDDHQCGFKFWRSNLIKREAKAAEDNRWFFDAEVLLEAQRHNARICVLPVQWEEHKESKVRMYDPIYFISAMIRYRVNKGRV